MNHTHWTDYALLDTGDGLKLERFGNYLFVRPESQAMWKRSLDAEWKQAHAVFQPTGEESGGHWDFKKKVDEKWEIRYILDPSLVRKGELKFWVMTTPGRHLGVFPEVAAHWDWLSGLIAQSKKEINVLNLFGYTGLATLAGRRRRSEGDSCRRFEKICELGAGQSSLLQSDRETHPLDRG